jgi:hypothetical protein
LSGDGTDEGSLAASEDTELRRFDSSDVSPVVVAVVESGLSVVFGASDLSVSDLSDLVSVDPADDDFTASEIFATAASMAFETASGVLAPLPLPLSPLPLVAPLLSDPWLLLTSGGPFCASGHGCDPTSALSPLPLLAPLLSDIGADDGCEPLATGPLGGIDPLMLELGGPDADDTLLAVTDDALPDCEAASVAEPPDEAAASDHELPGNEGPDGGHGAEIPAPEAPPGGACMP